MMFAPPTGVLGTDGVGAAAAPPPPQETKPRMADNPTMARAVMATRDPRLRRTLPKKTKPITPKLAKANRKPRGEFGKPDGRSAAAVPAVLITSVVLTAEVPAVTVAGLNVQVASAGRLLQENDTCEPNPPSPKIEMMIVAD